MEAQPSPNNLHARIWALASVLESTNLGLSCLLYSRVHYEGKMLNPDGGRLLNGFSPWEKVEISLIFARTLLLVISLCSYYLSIPCNDQKSGNQALRIPPLPYDEKVRGQSCYMKTVACVNQQSNTSLIGDAQFEEQAAWLRPDKLPSVSWFHYITNYTIFLPYLWPKNSANLMLTFSTCILLLILGRCVNVLVPYQVGKVITILSNQEESSHTFEISIPWIQIVILAFYSLLQGNSGLISIIRQMLWMPIGQFSSRGLAVAIFEHVHNLGFDFHMDKQTGELVSAMNKGGSINTFLDTMTFSVAPNIADLVIAMVYFGFAFDIYYSLITVLITFWYVFLTVRIASRRGDAKREVTNFQRLEEAVKSVPNSFCPLHC